MEEILQYIKDIAGAGGVLLSISVALFGVVKIIKLQWLQNTLEALPFFPKVLLWKNWPQWVRWVVVFTTGFGGGFLAAYAGGIGIAAAIVAGVTAALGAMGIASTDKHVLSPAARRALSLKTTMPKPDAGDP